MITKEQTKLPSPPRTSNRKYDLHQRIYNLLCHLRRSSRGSCCTSSVSLVNLGLCTNHRFQIDKSWLSQAVLLHPSTEFPHKEIQELPAKNKGGPYFELLSNSEAVTACDKSGSIVPSPKPLYIACHQRCLYLTKRCMASQGRASQRSVEESMQHIWLVLVNLFKRASEDKMRPVCNIYNAQAYGDIWRFQELVWEPSSDPFEAMVINKP